MRVAVTLLVLVVLAAVAAPASASVDDEERARGHYEIGVGLYRLGDYRGALKEFGAGYELAHKPGFLLNLGQTYRKLGELREARDMYRQFLAAVRGDNPARPQAQKVLAEIEDALRKAPPQAEAARELREPREPRELREAREAREAREVHEAREAREPSRSAAPGDAAAIAPVPPPAAAPPESAPPESAPLVRTQAPLVRTQAPVARAPIDRRHRQLRIGGIVVGGAGLALVGGGVGTAIAADGVARDLNFADAARAAFDASKDRAYSLDRGLSIGFFVGAAALAATGAVLLVVSAR